MNRRGFLSLLGAGVAGVALDQAIPFNRVWSFPKEIVLAQHPFDFEDELLRNLQRMQKLLPELFEIGDIVTFSKWPGRFVVTDIAQSSLNLYQPEGNLIYRGARADQVLPLLCGRFVTSNSL